MSIRQNLFDIKRKMNELAFSNLHFRIEWHSRGRRFNSVQLHQKFQGLTENAVGPFSVIRGICATPVPLFPVNTGEMK